MIEIPSANEIEGFDVDETGNRTYQVQDRPLIPIIPFIDGFPPTIHSIYTTLLCW